MISIWWISHLITVIGLIVYFDPLSLIEYCTPLGIALHDALVYLRCLL